MATPILKRTWALTGKTPIFRRRARSHEKVTVIGSVACRPSGTQAKFHFRMLPGKNANSAAFVAYLEQLKLNFAGEISVIWDNLNAHRSKKVKAWVQRHPRFKLEYFPPYAPELNPVEYAWGYLKGHAMKNFAARDLAELHARTKREACRMRRCSSIVQSWIRKSKLPMDSTPC